MPHRNVIFVDDDPTVELFAERTSDWLDCNFVFYRRISDANKDIAKLKPKLVVLDMCMTNLDNNYTDSAGLQISEHLREEYGNQFPIMVLTGHESPELISSCLRSGADDYCVKTHDFVDLMKRIASWLVIDYTSGDEHKMRLTSADALDHLVANQGLLTVKEWRKIAMKAFWNNAELTAH